MPAPEHPLQDGLFDAIDVGLIVLDGEHRIVGWNAWMEAASRIPMAAAKGRCFQEVFPNTPPRLATAITQAFDLGASSLLTHALNPSVFPLRTRTGKTLIHDVSVRAVGRRPALQCLLQIVDVTAMAGRERILRDRQNARYDAVVKSAPDTILTLDADLQDDPAEIPRFLAKLNEGHDVVSGWKQTRLDAWHKVWPSWVFNAMVSGLTGVRLHDHKAAVENRHADAGLLERVRAAVLEKTGITPTVELLPPGTLPRTSSGKRRRSEALARYLAGELTPPAPVTRLRLLVEAIRSALALRFRHG